MASVLNRATLQFLESVNTPDYPEPDWIISPDMSGVAGVPHRFWKLVGDAPVEMDQGEKDAVTAVRLDAERDELEIAHDARDLAGASIRLMVKEINILRVDASLAPRTTAQVKSALRSEING